MYQIGLKLFQHFVLTTLVLFYSIKLCLYLSEQKLAWFADESYKVAQNMDTQFITCCDVLNAIACFIIIQNATTI